MSCFSQVKVMPDRCRPGFIPRLPANCAKAPQLGQPSAAATGTATRERSRSRVPPIASGGQAIAGRSDAPLVVSSHCSGSRSLGLAAAASVESQMAALAAYEDRVYAVSSRGPRSSLWATWVRFHTQWYGSGPDAPPVLPLTPWAIRAVVAMLIAGNYKSGANYLSRAKDEHMRDHEWTSCLAREQRRANAAARRGQGPAHQSSELPVLRVCELQWSLGPLCPGGPLNFRGYFVIACFFVLREIEASLMLARSVCLDAVTRTVTISLPVSKTDPQALSCTRSWGCTCGGGQSRACPYHAAADQHALLLDRFGDTAGNLPAVCPFFPTAEGQAVDKTAVVESVEYVAAKLGLSLRSADGRHAFGGHVFRISGSRHLAAVGIDIKTIMLLARWQSDVVLRYVQDAPLSCLTAAYNNLSDSSRAYHQGFVAHRIPALLEGVGGDDIAARALELAECALKEATELKLMVERCEVEMRDLRNGALPTYVAGYNGTGPLHVCANSYILHPPSQWRTRCGWRYADADFKRLCSADRAESALCAKCFRTCHE